MKRLLACAAVVLLVAVPGCGGRSYHPDIMFAINNVYEMGRRFDAGEYDEVIRVAQTTLERLSDVSGLDEESRHEAYIERGIAWHFIGHAKQIAAVPAVEKGRVRYDDLFPLLGTPEGGYTEFQKALAEFDQAQELPHQYVSAHNRLYWTATAQMRSGVFDDAEINFQRGYEWAEVNGLGPDRMSTCLLGRVQCIHMHVAHMAFHGDMQMDRMRELTPGDAGEGHRENAGGARRVAPRRPHPLLHAPILRSGPPPERGSASSSL
ncbi:MAG: DUF501 domain-containing protein [Planctomycetota bacterium]|jgi:hypothetical protein